MSYYLINNKHRSSIRTDVIYETRNRDSYVFYIDDAVKIKYKYDHQDDWSYILLTEPILLHLDSTKKIPFSDFNTLILWNDDIDSDGESIFINKR